MQEGVVKSSGREELLNVGSEASLSNLLRLLGIDGLDELEHLVSCRLGELRLAVGVEAVDEGREGVGEHLQDVVEVREDDRVPRSEQGEDGVELESER